MITLAFANPDFVDLRQGLEGTEESAAILLCSPNRWGEEWRLNVLEMHVAEADHYIDRSSAGLRLAPGFCLPLERKARDKALSLVYVHTHPVAGYPDFSQTDDATELQLSEYLARRCPDVPHLALLFPRDAAARGRQLGRRDSVRIIEVGRRLMIAGVREGCSGTDRYDRQIRAFGAEGHARMARLRIGIVGLGGTGSAVAQQLAYLGAGEFTLVDHDVVELSNLNRVVGGVPSDAGITRKIDVAKRMISAIQPEANVRTIAGDVTDGDIARQLAGLDLLFNCTDTHGSRHVINQAAYQYLIPTIDLGVAITTSQDRLNTTFGGHVQMLAPGLPCLWCTNHLDSGRVRQDLMTSTQRLLDPYFQGSSGVVQPAVISINGAMASVAVTMFLAAVTGIPSAPRYVTYDGTRGRMNELVVAPNPDCPFCGGHAPVGYGDLVPLPVRGAG